MHRITLLHNFYNYLFLPPSFFPFWYTLSRIERLWRDVFAGVLDLFYHIFCNLERDRLLDTGEEIHIYALHWTFMPHIQRHLEFFKNGWNHHRLRTEGNQSPLQLWTVNPREGDQYPAQVCALDKHNRISTSVVQLQYFLKTREHLNFLPYTMD